MYAPSMAVNTARGLNPSFDNGMIDGTYKQLVRDREPTEPTTVIARANLGPLYDITESPVLHSPGGIRRLIVPG